MWIPLLSWEKKCYFKHHRQNRKQKGREWYINYPTLIFLKMSKCYNKFEKLGKDHECSQPPIIKSASKMIIKYHFWSSKLAKIKKIDNPECWPVYSFLIAI